MTQDEQTLKAIMEKFEPRLKGKLIIKLNTSAPSDWAVTRPLAHRKRVRVTFRDVHPDWCRKACEAAVETLSKLDEVQPLPPVSVLAHDTELTTLDAAQVKGHPEYVELRNGAYRIVIHETVARQLMESLNEILQ